MNHHVEASARLSAPRRSPRETGSPGQRSWRVCGPGAGWAQCEYTCTRTRGIALLPRNSLARESRPGAWRGCVVSEPLPLLLSFRRAARVFSVGRDNTLQKLIASGALRPVMIAGRRPPLDRRPKRVLGMSKPPGVMPLRSAWPMTVLKRRDFSKLPTFPNSGTPDGQRGPNLWAAPVNQAYMRAPALFGRLPRLNTL
jgi:hypothetical protein